MHKKVFQVIVLTCIYAWKPLQAIMIALMLVYIVPIEFANCVVQQTALDLIYLAYILWMMRLSIVYALTGSKYGIGV